MYTQTGLAAGDNGFMKRTLFALLFAGLQLLAGTSQAQPLNLGYVSVQHPTHGMTSFFYPTLAAEAPQRRGPFSLSWAADAPLAPGNGRLIVISHGSGGTPWVHTDLARELVLHGFVVVVPTHAGDNAADNKTPGPESWKKRPAEVSHAIDVTLAMPRFLDKLDPNKVGVFGGSAGGHTALSMTGGIWSPARFRDHCLANIEADFASCMGFTTRLTGGVLDGAKLWLARRTISSRFADETPQAHEDPRVKAVVAMVPFAADFDPASLATPRVPLGLITAAKDVNQVPRFHIEAIKAACLPRCTDLMTLPDAGHGAMLSPMPPFEPGSIAEQLQADPPGFDRAATVPLINKKIAEFFEKNLLNP
ncbi:alpha/beta hydrolase family protein [Hydrogenophaga sp. RWCD_12]|uniref:alpha/beta hydrolase family protein n=1 Tax=Hydrogenophaga sp. RWCD_12 TaxID=3391190 RepID=UPI0039855D5A